MKTKFHSPKNQVSLNLILSIILSAFLPFCLSAQNVTIKKNANNDHLIWPLNTSGSIFVGDGSGNSSTGLFNTGIGAFALNLNTTGNSNTGIGNAALGKTNIGGFNTAVGSSTMFENLTGTENTAIGTFALNNNKGRSRSTAIGYKAMYYANNATSAGTTFNTAVGYEALNGSVTPSNNTGIKNTTMGDQSMYLNTSGSSNSAFGFNAMKSNTTGFSNVAIGTHSLFSSTTRSNLVAVGDSALLLNGIGASGILQGQFNTAIGSKALLINTTGFQNTAVGFAALSANQTGGENTALGYVAGYNSTGSGNIFIGSFSGYGQTGSNKLYLSNSAATYTLPLLYGEFDNQFLKENGRMEINSASSSFDGLKVIKSHPAEGGSTPSLAAIYGQNTQVPDYGYGVSGRGGYVGVYGESTGSGGSSYIGIYGKSNGTHPFGENIGVFGEAFYGDYDYGGRFVTTGSGGYVNVGVDTYASGAGSNYGGILSADGFGGANTGISVSASGGSSENVGVIANATGNTGTKYGIRIFADGAGTNYAVRATATGGAVNYAGYFEGKTYVSNYFGVGVNPTHEIHVKQAGTTASSGIKFERNDNANNWVTNIDAFDDYNFYYGGTLRAYIQDNNGAYVIPSDQRLKQNIESFPSVLENVLKLNPSKYYYINTNNPDMLKSNGFIAQEVQALFPEVVAEKNGYLGIAYESMIPIAIKAIQEQQVIIDTQEARIAKLEALVQELIAKAK